MEAGRITGLGAFCGEIDGLASTGRRSALLDDDEFLGNTNSVHRTQLSL